MSEYAQASAFDARDRNVLSAGSHLIGDTRPLDTIATLADEAERSVHLITEFIDRFAGHGRAGSAAVAPVPSGHSGQIDRLRAALNDIDKLARELGTIG